MSTTSPASSLYHCDQNVFPVFFLFNDDDRHSTHLFINNSFDCSSFRRISLLIRIFFIFRISMPLIISIKTHTYVHKLYAFFGLCYCHHFLSKTNSASNDFVLFCIKDEKLANVLSLSKQLSSRHWANFSAWRTICNWFREK